MKWYVRKVKMFQVVKRAQELRNMTSRPLEAIKA
jgi:hypothetical protein